MKKAFCLLLLLVFAVGAARAQNAEVTIQLNEQFFDALLDAIFKHSGPPEFPLAEIRDAEKKETGEGGKISFVNAAVENKTPLTTAPCPENIRVQREIDGVRTAVRLRDGQIFAPLAFTGNYNPPLIGCIEFSGVAETNIELSFDRGRQALIGRARVLSVNLSGTGGIGSGIVANMVQSSIDRRVNPIEILKLDKISFVVPVQNSGALRMKAVDIRNEIGNGVLNVKINYEFQKAQ